MKQGRPSHTLSLLPNPLFVVVLVQNSVSRKLGQDWVAEALILKVIVFKHFLSKFTLHVFKVPNFINWNWPIVLIVHISLRRDTYLKCHEAPDRSRIIFWVFSRFAERWALGRFDVAEGLNKRSASLGRLVRRSQSSCYTLTQVCGWDISSLFPTFTLGSLCISA